MRIRGGLAAVLAGSLLVACGGGGGGGGGNGGGNGGPSNTITLDKSQVNLYADDYLNAVSWEEVLVTYSGVSVAVAPVPGQTLPAWLTISSPVVVSSTSSRVRLNFSQGALPNVPQRNSVTLRFTTADASGSGPVSRDIVVTGTLDHRLSRADDYLVVPQGAPNPGVPPLEVQTTNATWAAASDVPWLQVAPATGTGPGQLNLTVQSAGLAAASQVGTITVRDTLTNRSKTMRVHVSRAARQLTLSKRGVALSSTVGGAKLTQVVQISDSAQSNAQWTLASNAPWLTPSLSAGTGTQSVTLTANATGLADGLHFADLLVTPANTNAPPIASSETIKVGFYVDRTTPAGPVTVNVTSNPPLVAVMDPIRPYLYALAYGPGTTTLNVWNIYSGALVDSFAVPASSSIAVSPDGTKLLLPGSVSVATVALQGDTRTLSTGWTGLAPGGSLAFARLDGADIVVWSGGQLLNASNGAVLTQISGSTLGNFPKNVVTTPDGRAAFLVTVTSDDFDVERVALAGGQAAFSASVTGRVHEALGDGGGAAVDRTGRYLYACGGGDIGESCKRYDADTLAEQRSAANWIELEFRAGVEVLDSGHVYVASLGTFRHFDADLNTVATFAGAPSTARISADERRVLIVGASAQFQDLNF